MTRVRLVAGPPGAQARLPSSHGDRSERLTTHAVASDLVGDGLVAESDALVADVDGRAGDQLLHLVLALPAERALRFTGDRSPCALRRLRLQAGSGPCQAPPLSHAPHPDRPTLDPRARHRPARFGVPGAGRGGPGRRRRGRAAASRSSSRSSAAPARSRRGTPMADVSLPESGLVLCLENTDDGCALRIASLARPAHLVRRVRLDWSEWCEAVFRIGRAFAADLEESSVPAASRRAVRDRLRALRHRSRLPPPRPVAPLGLRLGASGRGARAAAERRLRPARARTARSCRCARCAARLGSDSDLRRARRAGTSRDPRSCTSSSWSAAVRRSSARWGPGVPAVEIQLPGGPSRVSLPAARLVAGQGDPPLDRRGGRPRRCSRSAPPPHGQCAGRWPDQRRNPHLEELVARSEAGLALLRPAAGGAGARPGRRRTHRPGRAGGAPAPPRGQHPPAPFPAGGARPGTRRSRPGHPGPDRRRRHPRLGSWHGRGRLGREAPRLHRSTPRGGAAAPDGRAPRRPANRVYGYGPQDAEPPLVPAPRRGGAGPGGHLRRAAPPLRRRAARRARRGLPHRTGALVLPSRADPAPPPRALRRHRPRRVRVRGAHRARSPRRHGALPGRRPPALHRAGAALGSGGAGPPRTRGSVRAARARSGAGRGAVADRAPAPSGRRRPPPAVPGRGSPGCTRTAPPSPVSTCAAGCSGNARCRPGATGGRAPRRRGAGGRRHLGRGGPGAARREAGVAGGRRRGRRRAPCRQCSSTGWCSPPAPWSARSTCARGGCWPSSPPVAGSGRMAVSPRLDVALLDESGDLAIHRLASHFAVVWVTAAASEGRVGRSEPRVVGDQGGRDTVGRPQLESPGYFWPLRAATAGSISSALRVVSWRLPRLSPGFSFQSSGIGHLPAVLGVDVPAGRRVRAHRDQHLHAGSRSPAPGRARTARARSAAGTRR